MLLKDKKVAYKEVTEKGILDVTIRNFDDKFLLIESETSKYFIEVRGNFKNENDYLVDLLDQDKKRYDGSYYVRTDGTFNEIVLFKCGGGEKDILIGKLIKMNA